MSRNERTIAAGAGFLLLWTALAAYTAQSQFVGREAAIAYDPIFFPSILIALGLMLSIGIIGHGLYRLYSGRQPAGGYGESQDPRRVFLLVALVGAFFAGMPTIGFIPASVLFIAVFTLVLGYRRGAIIVILSVLAPVTIWYVFTAGLRAPLPAFLVD